MTDPRTWPPGQKLLGLAGVLVFALVLLQGLESLAGRKSRPAPEPSVSRPAVRPTLERRGDWMIVLSEDRWRRSTYRFDETEGIETADRTYACLEQAIAREFDDNPTTSHREMRSRTRKIREECSPWVIPTLGS